MSHNHGPGCGCDHGQAGLSGEEFGVQYSLYQKIDTENLTCLNEEVENSGKLVFKPWEDRKNSDKVTIALEIYFDVTDNLIILQMVSSDADEELLFNIPFTGNVKLKGIIIMGSPDGSHPSKVKLYKNRPHMTFDDAASPCDQEFELVQDTDGTLEYATKVVKFSSVHHLSLHFPGNLGDEEVTKIYYIGLKGEFTEAHRTGVVNAVYEARPMLEDHKQDLQEKNFAQGPGF